MAVRALDRSSGGVVTLDARGVRLRLPRQRLQEPGAGPLPDPLGDLPARARRRPGRPLRRAGAPPRGAAGSPRRRSRRCGPPSWRCGGRKSMVLDDAADENRRSCGSFFVNPIVRAADAARVEARAGDPAMPRWPERGRPGQAVGRLADRARRLPPRRVGRPGRALHPPLARARRPRGRVRPATSCGSPGASGGGRDALRRPPGPEPVFWGFARLEDGLPAGPGVGSPTTLPDGTRLADSRAGSWLLLRRILQGLSSAGSRS